MVTSAWSDRHLEDWAHHVAAAPMAGADLYLALLAFAIASQPGSLGGIVVPRGCRPEHQDFILPDELMAGSGGLRTSSAVAGTFSWSMT